MTALYIIGAFSVFISLFSGFFNHTDRPKLRLLAKLTASLLFLAVALVAVLNAKTEAIYYVFILAALIFGMLGDLFLVIGKGLASEGGEPLFRIFGISTFLIGHIFYVALFFHIAGTFNYFLIFLIVIFPILLLVLTKLGFLKPKNYELALCMVYGVVLGLMAASVINLYLYTQTTRTLLIMIAGLLFAFSDSCLSIRMFKPNPKMSLKIFLIYAILSTYYTAQVIFAISIAV